MVDIDLKNDIRTKRLVLPNITVAIVDCVEFKRARRVLQHCINLCEFGDAKLFTNIAEKDLYVVPIEKISNVKEYSEFIVKKLGLYIKTDFVLVIQHDGFIVNIDKWTDEFLKYDYVGAPWHPSQLKPHMNTEHLVGNGGFSLRSKRLQQFLANDPSITEYHPEDVAICQIYRSYLEGHGFKFAPAQLANKFSCENYIWNNAFGQHQYFTLHPAR